MGTNRPSIYLREWREYRNIGQRALVEASGVASDTIVALERGDRTPWPRTLAKLALALDIEPYQLRELPPSFRLVAESRPKRYE